MIRRSFFAVLVAVAALAAVASTASAAGPPVKQEIVAQLKKIQANPEFKSLKTFKIQNVAEAKKAIPKLIALKTLYTSAGAAVAKSSATTTAEKTARKDWTAAVKLNATGISHLVTGLTDAIHGNKSGGQTEVDKGVKLDASANEESLKAYKLLGISLST